MNDLRVGCDADWFVRNYLEKVLKFKADNIISVDIEDKYTTLLEEKQISVVFMELPYQKVFTNRNYNNPVGRRSLIRRVLLNLVPCRSFRKGSPIVADVLKAILKVSEDGTLQRLEKD
ncbi:unnamed protein product [Linum trigynum]|uniref:Uncharacterized protein n=1 Tax=Linum trigynum TaxID=586398 RepID=A0AAV2ERJ6_9ROSI